MLSKKNGVTRKRGHSSFLIDLLVRARSCVHAIVSAHAREIVDGKRGQAT